MLRVALGAVIAPPTWAALLPELLSCPDATAAAPPAGTGRCTKCGGGAPPPAALQALQGAAAAESGALAALAAACGGGGAAAMALPALRKLAGAVDALGGHLHGLNQGAARSRARLAAAGAEVAGVPSPEDAAVGAAPGGGTCSPSTGAAPASAAVAAAGAGRPDSGSKPQALSPEAWRALARRAARRLAASGARREALGLAAAAARGAADAAVAHYGPCAPAAAHERLREGWLRLVLACGGGSEAGGGGADSWEEGGAAAAAQEAIAAACDVLRRHFGH
jgi:hypothetical protein